MTCIVALSGTMPQNEREAEGLGQCALVADAPPRDWDGNLGRTLLGRDSEAIRRVGSIKDREWLRWFDKAYLLDGDDEGLRPNVARRLHAMELLPSLTTRPRLILLGTEVARAFRVHTTPYYWTWVNWSAVHEGLELEDNRPQLVCVAPLVEQSWPNEAHLFWSNVARACRAKRARMN